MFASPELTWEGGTAWDASAPSALLLSGARRVLGWEVPRGLQSGAVRRAAHECEAEEQLALFAPKPLPATPSGGSVVRLACAAALL